MSGLLGLAGGLIGSAAQFGTNYGAALLDAKIQRDLRRTVYQDQMHSMRQAGLNPILAAGQSPGMGTSGTMDSAQISTAVDTALKGTKTKDERDLLEAQKTSAEAAAREAQAKADTAEALRDLQARDLEAGARGKEADASLKEDRVPWGRTFASNEAYEGIQRLEQARQLTNVNMPAVMRDQRVAEAGLTSAREQGVRFENIGKGIDAKWARDFEEMIRAGKTADQIIDRLGPMARTVLSARFPKMRLPRATRSRQSSAKGPIPGAGRDQLPADHPRRYSRDEFGNFVDKHTGEVLK